MKKWNLVLSALFIVFAVSIFFMTSEYSVSSDFDPGPAFWPRMLAVALIVLSLMLVVQTMTSREYNEDQVKPINFLAPEMKNVYIMLGVFVIFALSLIYIGFIISSLWFVPAVMYVMGERTVKKLALTSALLTGSVYFFFTLLLRITLPQPFFM